MRTFRWTSEAGRAAVARLDAYGELRRYELAGEVAALTTASGGGGKRKPGDMPGSFLRAWDVELSLREWGVLPESRLVRLLDFIWTKGREEVVVAYRYVLHDNAENGALRMTPQEIAEQGEPGRYLDRQEEKAMRSTYDLDDFDDDVFDSWAKSFAPPYGDPEEYMAARNSLLRHLHDRFALFMVVRRGLDAPNEKTPKAIPFAAASQPYGEPTEEERGYAA